VWVFNDGVRPTSYSRSNTTRGSSLTLVRWFRRLSRKHHPGVESWLRALDIYERTLQDSLPDLDGVDTEAPTALGNVKRTRSAFSLEVSGGLFRVHFFHQLLTRSSSCWKLAALSRLYA